MKAIIIGAGRGRRLMPLTEDVPKCYAEIGGRRILDWCLDALGSASIKDTVFIGGYLIDRVRADYPHFRFVHNAEWESNNILVSLMHARVEMAAVETPGGYFEIDTTEDYHLAQAGWRA